MSRADLTVEESTRIMEVLDLCAVAFHANAREKGFWDDIDPDDPRHIASLLALIHSEISEALEEVRAGNWDKFKTEVGDAMIRIFDMMGGLNLDIGYAVVAKHEKNRLRPNKHGKQF